MTTKKPFLCVLHFFLLIAQTVVAFVVPPAGTVGAGGSWNFLRLHDVRSPDSSSASSSAPTSASSSLMPLSPGFREDELFQELDDSVAYWKDFESLGNQQNVQRIREILQKYLIDDRTSSSNNNNNNVLSRAYWGSHIVRSGYFTLNAALGSIASDLHERFIAQRRRGDHKDGTANGSDSSPVLAASERGSMVQRLLDSDIPSRLLLETVVTYEQDYKHIASGLLKYPWDALVQFNSNDNHPTGAVKLQWNHRQFNPFFVASETARAVQESIGIFSRRNKGEQTKLWQSSTTMTSSSTATARRANLQGYYPDYYMNDFHYQTDGWLSSESARRYEIATETLFLGRQDAMQRQTLLPLLEQYRGRASGGGAADASRRPLRILEVACGTGRFGTFLRDNFPAAELTMTDLSPYYLEKARENDDYWRSFQKENSEGRKRPPPANFVQANAEYLPFEDNYFDAVVCVYLFHELPADARRRVAAEMERVVVGNYHDDDADISSSSSGSCGMIVVTDSMQVGDRPQFSNIRNFAKLNEPHYVNYVEETLVPDLFPNCECHKKYMISSTKTTSFVKKKKN